VTSIKSNVDDQGRRAYQTLFQKSIIDLSLLRRPLVQCSVETFRVPVTNAGFLAIRKLVAEKRGVSVIGFRTMAEWIMFRGLEKNRIR